MAMIRTASGILFLVSLFFASGCTLPQESKPSRQTSAGPVIGHLETRDKKITIRTGSDGPLYTVKSESGKILAVDLPAGELSDRFPELKDIVERGIVDHARSDQQHQQILPPCLDDRPEPCETKTIIIEPNK